VTKEEFRPDRDDFAAHFNAPFTGAWAKQAGRKWSVEDALPTREQHLTARHASFSTGRDTPTAAGHLVAPTLVQVQLRRWQGLAILRSSRS
jgi:hypothetical protein